MRKQSFLHKSKICDFSVFTEIWNFKVPGDTAKRHPKNLKKLRESSSGYYKTIRRWVHWNSKIRKNKGHPMDQSLKVLSLSFLNKLENKNETKTSSPKAHFLIIKKNHKSVFITKDFKIWVPMFSRSFIYSRNNFDFSLAFGSARLGNGLVKNRTLPI